MLEPLGVRVRQGQGVLVAPCSQREELELLQRAARVEEDLLLQPVRAHALYEYRGSAGVASSTSCTSSSALPLLSPLPPHPCFPRPCSHHYHYHHYHCCCCCRSSP